MREETIEIRMPRVPVGEILTRALENALAVAIERGALNHLDRAGADTPAWVERHSSPPGSIIRTATETAQRQVESLHWQRRMQAAEGLDVTGLDARLARFERDRDDLITRLCAVSTTPRNKPDPCGEYVCNVNAHDVMALDGRYSTPPRQVLVNMTPAAWLALQDWRFELPTRPREQHPIWQLRGRTYTAFASQETESEFRGLTQNLVACLTPEIMSLSSTSQH